MGAETTPAAAFSSIMSSSIDFKRHVHLPDHWRARARSADDDYLFSSQIFALTNDNRPTVQRLRLISHLILFSSSSPLVLSAAICQRAQICPLIVPKSTRKNWKPALSIYLQNLNESRFVLFCPDWEPSSVDTGRGPGRLIGLDCGYWGARLFKRGNQTPKSPITRPHLALLVTIIIIIINSLSSRSLSDRGEESTGHQLIVTSGSSRVAALLLVLFHFQLLSRALFPHKSTYFNSGSGRGGDGVYFSFFDFNFRETN